MLMTKPPAYIQTDKYMPQKENPAHIYRDIIFRLSKQMDSLNAQWLIDQFERYVEALPDEMVTARTYMRDRLADISKMMNQDIFTAAKARELFATLVSDWDNNKIGSALEDLGSGYLNKTHANPVIRKRMEEIQKLVSDSASYGYIQRLLLFLGDG